MAWCRTCQSFHRLSRFAAPRLLKLWHVLHHAIHAILPRRVRIGKHGRTRDLRTPLLAPHTSKSKKETLLGGVAVDLPAFLSGFVVRDHVLQRHQSDARAPVVGAVLSQPDLAVPLDVIPRHD